MANEIKSILAELYQLDPELKKHEATLTKMIAEIIKVKPDTKFDKQFAARLKSELTKNPQTTNSIFNLFDMKKLIYALGGAALTALVIIPIFKTTTFNNEITPTSDNQVLSLFDTSLKITRLDGEAFGSLINPNTAQPAAAPMPSFERNQAGGGGQGLAPEIAMGFGGGGGTPPSTATTDSKMIVYPGDFVSYKYIYKGDELNLDQNTVEVLKRVKGLDNSNSINNLLKSFNLGLLDLKTFTPASIDNLSITQGGSYSYLIHVNTTEGFISINKNWLTWPQLNCTNDNCDNLRVRENQIPDDETIVKIANDFIKQHNISLEGYGAPEVQAAWRFDYERAPNKSEYWFPDTINVIYPLEINGQQVYEQYGTDKVGLIVSVDIREKKAAGLANLMTQSYQASNYQAETDTKKILGIAEQGGLNGWYPVEGSKVEEVELGTPTMGLAKFYIYRENQNDEILVPSLIFPIIKQPENLNYFGNRTSVIVPLATELLKDQINPPIRIMPVPTPLIEASSGESASPDSAPIELK